ncbi:hypothetical protein [Solibaculum intestinale]|uniref:RHS repeat-associated core domain-containing protein n=1 Tax=Solibaculum intestinale TaxID=3133165 RepID=A0ABV1DZU8_9FIRM
MQIVLSFANSTTNLFSYCRNNPVKYIDPSGRMVVTIGTGVSAYCGAGGQASGFYAFDGEGNYAHFGSAGFLGGTLSAVQH